MPADAGCPSSATGVCHVEEERQDDHNRIVRTPDSSGAKRISSAAAAASLSYALPETIMAAGALWSAAFDTTRPLRSRLLSLQSDQYVVRRVWFRLKCR